ncbi:MAG: hypothetical protein AAFV95_28440 [Bacteroidota bacterium]
MKRMKMTRRKNHLVMVVSFLLACFLFSVDASAQYYPNLVDEAEAQTMLTNEIPTLENAVGNLVPNTPEYALAERKYSLYVHTWETLSTGETVEAALTSAYGEYAVDANGYQADEDEFVQLDKEVVNYGDQAFDDLVNFLRK